MGTAVEKDASKPWDTYRSSRTKAMPKHTLFGSSLEQLGSEEMNAVHRIDLEAYQAQQDKERQANRRTRHQPGVSSSIQGEPVLQHTKEELAKRLSRSEKAKEMLQTAEERARYFSMAGESSQSQSPKSKPRVKDIKLLQAELLNDVGLNGSNAYNRERQQQRPPVHRYALIGDVMRLGMDFNSSYKEDYANPHYFRGMSSSTLPKHGRRAQEPVRESPKSAIDLPPNIKHQFGTQVCNSVLADLEKVRATMDEQKNLKESLMRKRTEVPVASSSPSKTDPAYQSLSNALRQNVCPGYSVNNKSFAKSVYTMDVHANRVPDPDQFRYQRDQLSTWAEQNVLRERVKKAWDTYLAETMQKAQT